MQYHAEHVCPEFCMQLFTPAAIALSNGASSSTTNADLPPNSRQTFLMPSPATAAMRRPACSEPVKLTMSTFGIGGHHFADNAAGCR